VAVPAAVLIGLVVTRLQATQSAAAQVKSEAAARRGAAVGVEYAVAGPGTLQESVEAVANVTPEFAVAVSPRVAGRIVEVRVREGDRVRPGQLLARIDPETSNALLRQSQAELNESRSRLAQAEATLRAQEIQIEQAVRRARAELAAAQAEVVRTQRDVEGREAAANAAVRQAQAQVSSAAAEVRNRRAELAADQVALKNAESRVDRVKAQFDKGYVSAQEMENAQGAQDAAVAAVAVRRGEIESAEAELASAQAELESRQVARRTAQTGGRAEVQAGQARVRQAEADVAAAIADRAQTPANRENLNALRAGVASQQAQLNSAEVQRSEADLRATAEGIVVSREADPGAVAVPGQPILRIESAQNVFLESTFPVEVAGRIRVGMPLEAEIDGMEGPTIRARVDRVVPSADPLDRRFRVLSRIGSRDGALRPGMFGRVRILLGETRASVLVPLDAVRDGEVAVIDAEGKAQTRVVKVGARDGRQVQITEGVSPGERVIVLSYSAVRDGATVNPSAERRPDGSVRRIEAAPKGAQL
jgi:RND family efflux transporter MFP subunit